MLFRKKQLAGKVETIEGTAETLAAADAKVLVYNQKIEYDPQRFKQNPIRSSLSKLKKITGQLPGQLSFSFLLQGSGSISTQPEWVKYFRACGTQINVVYTITVGAIASGPFVHGEVITGASSSATGRVIKNTANGTTTLYFVALSGTFSSGETITGGTSGASATTGSTPAVAGYVIEPLSEGHPSLTIASYEGGSLTAAGIRKLLRGCRGSSKLSFKIGEPVNVESTFMGVEAGVTDTTFLSGISPESTTAPIFLNGTVQCDSTSMKISEFEFDMGTELTPDDDVEDTKGITSFIITDRDEVGSFDPKTLNISAHDFYGNWFSDTELELLIAWGSAAGNSFEFYAPRIQYDKVVPEDRGGQMVERVQFDINGSIALDDIQWALLLL